MLKVTKNVTMYTIKLHGILLPMHHTMEETISPDELEKAGFPTKRLTIIRKNIEIDATSTKLPCGTTFKLYRRREFSSDKSIPWQLGIIDALKYKKESKP